MGILGTDLSLDSFVGIGQFGIKGLILFTIVSAICIMILGIILYIVWLATFNHRCIIYDITKSGISQMTKMGGLRRNFKNKKLEFKIKGEKFRIDRFDKNKVIAATRKGKPTIYLFRRKNDLMQILDMKFVEAAKNSKSEKELKFIAESLGESDWEGDYQTRTEDMFTIRNFWSQYGRDVVYISAMITLSMISLVAITQL